MGERERKCERGGVLEMEEEREGVGTAKRKRISYFDIQNPILTFELGPNIVF